MPYGLPNETKEDEHWMERCVNSIMKKHPDYSKERCIRICKKSRMRDKTLSNRRRGK